MSRNKEQERMTFNTTQLTEAKNSDAYIIARVFQRSLKKGKMEYTRRSSRLSPQTMPASQTHLYPWLSECQDRFIHVRDAMIRRKNYGSTIYSH